MTILSQQGWSESRIASVSLAILSVTQFLDFLNLSALNIAIPTIADELKIAPGLEGWILISYSLALSAFMLPFGKLGDAWGHRNIFICGLLIMTVANIFSAMAPTLPVLATFRGLQGLGAAATMPNASAIIARIFPAGAPRNAAFAKLGAASAIGSAAGLIVGGLFSGIIGWRYVFYVLAPICLLVMILSLVFLPAAQDDESVDKGLKDFDISGTLTWLVGMSLIVYVLSSTKGTAWKEVQTMVLLGIGFASFGSFFFVERTAARPLIPPYLWKNHVIVVNSILIAMVRGGASMFVYLMSLKLQRILLLSPWETALQSLPMAIVGFFYSFFVGTIVKKLGFSVPVILGFGMAVFGSAYFLFSLHGADENGNNASSFWTSTFPSSVVFVLGTPMVFISAQLAMLNVAEPRQYAVVGALFNTAGQIGGPVALALLTAIMNVVLVNKGSGWSEKERLLASYDAGNWTIVVWELAGLVLAGLFWLRQKFSEEKRHLSVDVESNEGERERLLGDSSTP
ncbi:hypothetical protein SpCBS45565_g02372 [Spizellomyces sp. 'palustris']|nr:hypothetical protein SpCBS45565_g02372 [Spizellomyces sp. 'palustris']